LKFKSEVASIFLKFKSKVENECDYKIQTLRYDNGKDYNSHKLNLFCDEARKEHQLTTPYTLEQNGASKRKIDL